MRCLITGGAGFIGSHLAEALLAAGHEVALYDNLNAEYDPARKRANLRTIDAPFVEADILDGSALESALAAHRSEIVFHLAALPGVRRSVEVPGLCDEINARGTAQVVAAARRAGVAKLIFASSSAVYGIGTPLPFDEVRTAPLPISPYAVAKLTAEHHCRAASLVHGLPTVCLRLFTVYGPRQRPDLAIQKFIRAALEGRELTLYGNGASRRDYTYCADAVAGFLAAMRLSGPFEIVNIASGRPVSLLETVDTIRAATGASPAVRHIADQPGDLEATAANLEKAARLLAYSPAIPFAEGIRRQVEWNRAVFS